MPAGVVRGSATAPVFATHADRDGPLHPLTDRGRAAGGLDEIEQLSDECDDWHGAILRVPIRLWGGFVNSVQQVVCHWGRCT